MTPPTIHEFAGIFMLALLTAGLIAHSSTVAHSSTRTHAAPAPAMTDSAFQMDTSYIDGIATIALPAPQGTDNAKAIESASARR